MASYPTVPLATIRATLASLEDPILRAISFRKDVPMNEGLYRKRPLFSGLSLFDIKLYGRELQRALAGEYLLGERPLSKLWLPRTVPNPPDMTQFIRQLYVEFLHDICRQKDDHATYDDAFVRDLDALWFLSDRIHEAGLAVGRTKLESASGSTLAAYQEGIRNKDVNGLIILLRDDSQENSVISRVREKALTSRLHPDIAELLFREVVFPATLQAEALDLIQIHQPT